MPISRRKAKAILKNIIDGSHLGILRADPHGNLIQHYRKYMPYHLPCINTEYKELVINILIRNYPAKKISFIHSILDLFHLTSKTEDIKKIIIKNSITYGLRMLFSKPELLTVFIITNIIKAGENADCIAWIITYLYQRNPDLLTPELLTLVFRTGAHALDLSAAIDLLQEVFLNYNTLITLATVPWHANQLAAFLHQPPRNKKEIRDLQFLLESSETTYDDNYRAAFTNIDRYDYLSQSMVLVLSTLKSLNLYNFQSVKLLLSSRKYLLSMQCLNINSLLLALDMKYVFNSLQAGFFDSAEADSASKLSSSAIKIKKLLISYPILSDTYLLTVEAEIRYKILQEILDEAKHTTLYISSRSIIELLTESNMRILATRCDLELNSVFGKLITSNTIISHIAWRAYDNNASYNSTSGWVNLLSLPPTIDATSGAFTTLETSRHFEESIPPTIETCSKRVRIIAASCFKAAIDPSLPEDLQKELLIDFFSQIADIRRAHCDDKTFSTDDPSCYPGTLSRLGLTLKRHPNFQEPLNYDKEIKHYITHIISLKFNAELLRLETALERQQLYYSLLMLGLDNIEEVIRNPRTISAILPDDSDEYLSECKNKRACFFSSLDVETIYQNTNTMLLEKGISITPQILVYTVIKNLFSIRTLLPTLSPSQQKLLQHKDEPTLPTKDPDIDMIDSAKSEISLTPW